MSLKQNLRAVRAKIANIDDWCQGSLAADKDGISLADPLHPEACRWCLEGAVMVMVGADDEGSEYGAVAEALERCALEKFPAPRTSTPARVRVNDGQIGVGLKHTIDAEVYAQAHANVLAVIDCAIGHAA